MPGFELLLVLQCYLLIAGPHFRHDLTQVLSFRSVNINTDANLGDLGSQLGNILFREKSQGVIS